MDGCILLGHYPDECYEKMDKEFRRSLVQEALELTRIFGSILENAK